MGDDQQRYWRRTCSEWTNLSGAFFRRGRNEMPCKMLLYNGSPIGVTPPNHVILKVEYTEPAVRGNTATNVTKPAKLETGAEIIVPNFIETGEVIKVDTRTNEYVERVK